MSAELRADYNQIMLLPPSLEDWIASDHMARYVREFVDSIDLKDLGFKHRKNEDGRPSYAPDLLLKVWLYGYLERIRSSRKLEKACRNEIPLIWLTGMHYPDHNTLWRFWRDNQKAIKEVFHKTVRVALDAGLIGMVVHAVDGTRIQACASTQTMWRKESLEKLLGRVEESIQVMAAEVSKLEKEEAEEYRLPEEFQEKIRLKERIEKGLAELQKRAREQMNASEPDAVVVKTNDGKRLGYNAQVVVDDKRKLIVAEEVTTDQNDKHQLIPMIEKVQESLDRTAEETIADAGYCSGEQMEKAEKEGYEVIVNLKEIETAAERGGEYHSSRFIYDEQNDCMTCPRGKVLSHFSEGKYHRNGYTVQLYKCQSYKDCPVRWQCSKSKRGRIVKLSPYNGAILRQKEKQKSPEKLKILKQRIGIVEPVMAWAKHLLGFKRWTVRGIDQVRSQWAFLCASINLNKLYLMWRKGEIAWE